MLYLLMMPFFCVIGNLMVQPPLTPWHDGSRQRWRWQVLIRMCLVPTAVGRLPPRKLSRRVLPYQTFWLLDSGTERHIFLNSIVEILSPLGSLMNLCLRMQFWVNTCHYFLVCLCYTNSLSFTWSLSVLASKSHQQAAGNDVIEWTN